MTVQGEPPDLDETADHEATSDIRKTLGLKELEERVREARTKNDSIGWKKTPDEGYDASGRAMLSLALRVGTELVAALVVGVGGGMLLDYWFGTKPWGLVVMFLLGAAGGVANVYRALNGLGYAPGYGMQDGDGKNGGGAADQTPPVKKVK